MSFLCSKKNVLLVTTAHDQPVIDSSFKRKPESILFYNEQRCDVDIFNRMIRELTTQPKTDEWRFSVFTLLIDIACINAHTILKYNALGKHLVPRQYLKSLVHQLTCPWLRKRFLLGHLKENTKAAI